MTTSGDHADVMALLARERSGVLCTLHSRHESWPFGSLAPYALTDAREPIFLFSGIAEHTRNLRADGRASLLVQDSGAREDPLAGARVTLMGRAEELVGEPRALSLATYLARFPKANAFATAHDFSPFILRIERARWIAGFGAMGYIERGQW